MGDIIGSGLTEYRNGSAVLGAADTTYSSGRVGLSMFILTISTAEMDNWSAGGFMNPRVPFRSNPLLELIGER
jgi:hypothetical protein